MQFHIYELHRDPAHITDPQAEAAYQAYRLDITKRSRADG